MKNAVDIELIWDTERELQEILQKLVNEIKKKILNINWKNRVKGSVSKNELNMLKSSKYENSNM